MIQVNFNEVPASLATMNRVDKDVLKNTGRTLGSFMLCKGDTIQFPPKELIEGFNDSFKIGDRTVDCVKFKCAVNGEIKALPCGILTKMPYKQIESWLAEHPVNRDIYNAGNALARLEMLAGKELIVADLVTGPRADFDDDGKVKKDEHGNDMTKDGLFAVFAYSE